MEPHTLAHWASPVLLVIILCALVWMIRCANKAEDNKYRVLDLFVNAEGKADIDKHVLAAAFVLSAWAVVVKTMGLYKGEEITGLLLGVLGIFVGKRAADNWTKSKSDSTTTSATRIERTADAELQTSVETTKGPDK